jgi:hypothetical protein
MWEKEGKDIKVVKERRKSDTEHVIPRRISVTKYACGAYVIWNVEQLAT